MTSVPPSSIPVVVAGALGRMGAEVVRAIHDASDCELVGAVETTPDKEGLDIGEELGLGTLDVALTSDFEACICSVSQNSHQTGPGQGAVLVDFTHPSTNCFDEPLLLFLLLWNRLFFRFNSLIIQQHLPFFLVSDVHIHPYIEFLYPYMVQVF